MATPQRKTDRETDFDPLVLLAGHGEHEKNITDLTARVNKLEDKFETPQQVAAFLKECAEDSRILEGVFAQMFCRFMAENKDVQIAVKKKIEEIDRQFIAKTIRRFGLAIYTVLIVIVTSIGKQLLDWALLMLPHK